VSKRIGFVGSGRIAEFHVKAAIGAGFDVSVICGRPGSQSLEKIKMKFPHIATVTSIEDMYKYELDAFSIITNSDSLLKIYETLIETYDVPILIEKPVTLSSNLLEVHKIDLFRQKTVVGYNRRFYSSVQELKMLIDSNPNFLQSHWNIPEISWEINSSKSSRELFIKDNSVHMLDLLLFLNGSIRNMVLKKINSKNLAHCCSGIIEFENGRLITINLSFGVPDNTYFSYFAPGLNFQLKPIEILYKFEDLEMLPASEESPIKKYVPKVKDNWQISQADREYKPGFLLQYKELMNLCFDKPKIHSASLYDALQALKLAESIISV
jgi:predicted dehydrogenase